MFDNARSGLLEDCETSAGEMRGGSDSSALSVELVWMGSCGELDVELSTSGDEALELSLMFSSDLSTTGDEELDLSLLFRPDLPLLGSRYKCGGESLRDHCSLFMFWRVLKVPELRMALNIGVRVIVLVLNRLYIDSRNKCAVRGVILGDLDTTGSSVEVLSRTITDSSSFDGWLSLLFADARAYFVKGVSTTVSKTLIAKGESSDTCEFKLDE